MLLMIALPFVAAEESTAADTTAEKTNEIAATSETAAEQSGDASSTAGEPEVDEATKKEMKIANSPFGAEVRLLQLEKVISRSILQGNEAIEALKKAGKDTTSLQATLTELEDLRTEVQNADPKAEDAVVIFVDLKQDAKDLVNEFRTKVKSLVSADEVKELRQKIKAKIKEADASALQDINGKIKAQMHAYNTDRLKQMFEALGIKNDELLQKFANGEATQADVMSEIKAKLKSLPKEQRKETMQKLKEAGLKQNISMKSMLEKVRLNHLQRRENRLTKRLERAGKIHDEGLKAEITGKLQEKMKEVGSRQARAENRMHDKEKKEQNERDSNKGNEGNEGEGQ